MSGLNLSALVVGLSLAWGCGMAQAQAKPAPAKPAATSAGESKTLDGKASTSGKVMSINELRACLSRQDALRLRRVDVERERSDLDAERTKIQQENDATQAERDSIAKRSDAVKDYNVRMKAFGEKVAAWNARLAELNGSNRAGSAAERERKDLDAERVSLQKTDADFKAEGATLTTGLQEALNQLNARVNDQQKRATDWNERNTKSLASATAYEDERTMWREECGNRRYREDDEKALRSGK